MKCKNCGCSLDEEDYNEIPIFNLGIIVVCDKCMDEIFEDPDDEEE